MEGSAAAQIACKSSLSCMIISPNAPKSRIENALIASSIRFSTKSVYRACNHIDKTHIRALTGWFPHIDSFLLCCPRFSSIPIQCTQQFGILAKNRLAKPVIMKTTHNNQLGERSSPVRLHAIPYPTSQDRHRDYDMHFHLLAALSNSKSFPLRKKSRPRRQQRDILLDKRGLMQRKPFLPQSGRNYVL